MRRTIPLPLILLLACAPCSAALMKDAPMPAPDWLHVRLTPLTSWRASTRILFAPGEIDYTGFPLPAGGLSYIGFHSLYFDIWTDPTADQFWIFKATDNIVATIARNQGFGTFAEHNFAPEFAAGLDDLTVTLGAYNPVTGFRAFTYTGAGGYSRSVRLATEHVTGVVPEPAGLVLLALGAVCLGSRRRGRRAFRCRG